MTSGAQEVLDSFEALTDADKHQVAVEILRRLGATTECDLAEALIGAADELFRGLDAGEVDSASP